MIPLCSYHFILEAFSKLANGKQEKIYSMYFIYRVSCYDALSDNPVLLPSECQQGTLDFFPSLVIVYESTQRGWRHSVPKLIVLEGITSIGRHPTHLERSALLGNHDGMDLLSLLKTIIKRYKKPDFLDESLHCSLFESKL